MMKLFVILLLSLFSISLAKTSSSEESFVQCLNNLSTSVFTPQNPSYPSVLQTYIRNLRFNESTTPKPVLIITAMRYSDIQMAIVCAKKHGLQMKIRSGGHDYEGISYWSESPFFVLDLFNLRSVDVDTESKTAWVETGATLGEVYYKAANATGGRYGYPAGVCPTVGVGGHLSGAGYGNMMRKYGLTVDNIVDAKIITVDGRILDRKSMGEDLFWAITGGGASSYGVALAYKINLVPVPHKVTVFRVRRTMEQNATDLIYKWQRIADKLDDDLFIRLTIDVVKENVTGGGEKKTVRATFIALFLGNSNRLLSIMNQSFPQLGLNKTDCIEMSWLESVLFWTNFPLGTPNEALLSRTPQVLNYLKRKSDYLKKPMSREGLEFILEKMVELERIALTFNPYGGKMARIPASAKPFPHRAGNICKIQYATNWNEGGAQAANFNLNLTRVLYAYMTPFVSNSPRQSFWNYRDLDLGVNHNGNNSFVEGASYGIKYFVGNYERLVKIKTKVDPDNFFRNEQSIPTLPSWRN